MNIFIYRLALINSWALVILDEISTNSIEVQDQLDDWIVISVSEENSLSQQVLFYMKECIISDQIKIDEYQITLSSLSLLEIINIRHFSCSETPKYLRSLHIPTEVDSVRFTLSQLRDLYTSMRYTLRSKGSLDMLDQQSFINIMLLAYR